MKRKKINPNRIPISPKNYDLEEIKKINNAYRPRGVY